MYRYCFLVFVPISCIGTIILYAYRSLVSVLFSCKVISFMFTTWHAITCLLTPACYHLTLVRYHLSPAMSDTWLIIITIREWWLDILIYPDIFILLQTVLLYTCTPDTCSCSFSYTDNYLIINYKKTNLCLRIRGNRWILSGEYICGGNRYIVQLQLSDLPEGL